MSNLRAPEAAPPLTVAVDAPEPIRRRALWVLESLLAVADIAWEAIPPNTAAADIGYGCPGAVELVLDGSAWDATVAPPRGADEIAYAFWWLARVEELHATDADRDRHGRYRADRSHMAAVASRAPVDDIAMRLIERLGRRPAPWTGDHTFAVALSHDIDTPVRWTAQGVRRCLRRARESARAGDLRDAASCLGALAGIPYWKLRRSDPHRNERDILELERRHGGASTSYLIAGHHHALDGNAEAYGRVRASLAAAIRDAGGEVGLHASYTTMDVPARLFAERTRLEEEVGHAVTALRHHFLRHDPPRAWPLMERAGFTTDASLGYADRIGFRSGFSFPYRAWDHSTDRPLSLLLVPLAVMDATLDDSRYGNLNSAAAAPLIDAVLDHGKQHGSGFSILWHNDRFYRRLARGYDDVYEKLLAAARDRGAWLAPVGTLAESWQARLAVGRWSDAVPILASERRGVTQ